MNTRYGAIELGGTKCLAAVFDEFGTMLDSVRIPTQAPGETLQALANFFMNKQVHSFGIGAFGPINLDETSSSYGQFQHTPKPGWNSFNVHSFFEERFHVPIGVATDVEVAALGEYQKGAGQGAERLIYLTVGTGVGGALLQHGQPLIGSHGKRPEMGHVAIHHVANQSSTCIHRDCLEGFVSGPAILKHYGSPAESLDSTKAWQAIADYLSQGIMSLTLSLLPDRIILGGGVMQHPALLTDCQALLKKALSGYAGIYIEGSVGTFLVAPELGDQSGLVGAWVVAQRALVAA